MVEKYTLWIKAESLIMRSHSLYVHYHVVFRVSGEAPIGACNWPKTGVGVYTGMGTYTGHYDMYWYFFKPVVLSIT